MRTPPASQVLTALLVLAIVGARLAGAHVAPYCVDEDPAIEAGVAWDHPADPDPRPTFTFEGRGWFQPVTWAQAAHALIDDGRLVEAEVLADELWEHQRDGWFAYEFDVPATDQEAPWYSAMAQGEVLGVFARLGQLDRARIVYDTLSAGSRVTDDRGWLLEYPGFPPVLNGAIFAAFGVYQYWQATGLGQERFEEIVGVIARDVHRFRSPNSLSTYELDGRRQYQNYHDLHVSLLRALAARTGMECLTRAADDFDADA